jgi:saccharopine dehydrogenase-like NADP-dependent oxidoreductase
MESAIKNIVKTFVFLGFYDPEQSVKVKDASGKARPCLDVLGDVMGTKLALDDYDRDLVVMRHVFHIQDPKDGQRWEHTSTMVASGKCKADRGETIMSQTVGITCALATRLVLDKKISQRGVLSPMEKEIYTPILKALEKKGIVMVEESANPRAHMIMSGPKAKM